MELLKVVEWHEGRRPHRIIVYFEADVDEADESGEQLDDPFFGFGRIGLRSDMGTLVTERPFSEVVGFHPLDDAQFFRLVRSLATVGMERSNTTPSRGNPRLLQKTIRADSLAQDFVPTALQVEILRALDCKAMTKQALADSLCKGDGSRLYKRGGIMELTQHGKVTNKPGVGYYRPDRPPKWE